MATVDRKTIFFEAFDGIIKLAENEVMEQRRPYSDILEAAKNLTDPHERILAIDNAIEGIVESLPPEERPKVLRILARQREEKKLVEDGVRRQ